MLDSLEGLIRKNLSLAVSASFSSSQFIEIQPEEAETGFKFNVEASVSGSRLRIQFIPGKYSKTLLSKIPENIRSNLKALVIQSERLNSLRGKLSILEGGSKINIEGLVDKPRVGSDFTVILRMGRRKDCRIDDDESMEMILEFMVFVLLLVPSYEESLDDRNTFKDGAIRNLNLNTYERNPINRKICLDSHGFSCKVCAMDFNKEYGDLGKGFIHVHHVIELSLIREAYVVDPVNDLVPVCPNCHAMLHRKKPALTVKELREIKNKKQLD